MLKTRYNRNINEYPLNGQIKEYNFATDTYSDMPIDITYRLNNGQDVVIDEIWGTLHINSSSISMQYQANYLTKPKDVVIDANGREYKVSTVNLDDANVPIRLKRRNRLIDKVQSIIAE